MNGVPLHAALVHLPLVLSVLLPVIAIGVAIAVCTGRAGRRAWVAVVALNAVLVASVFVAVETGEGDEDRVEKVAGHDAVETHERHAKRLLKGSGAALAVTGLVACAPVAALPAATALVSAGMAALAYLGITTGHSGGELVYVHGAAGAYTTGAPALRTARRGHDD